MGFDDRTMMPDGNIDDTLYKNTNSSNLRLDDRVGMDHHDKPMDIDFEAQARSDGFGEALDDFGKLSQVPAILIITVVVKLFTLNYYAHFSNIKNSSQ